MSNSVVGSQSVIVSILGCRYAYPELLTYFPEWHRVRRVAVPKFSDETDILIRDKAAMVVVAKFCKTNSVPVDKILQRPGGTAKMMSHFIYCHILAMQVNERLFIFGIRSEPVEFDFTSAA